MSLKLLVDEDSQAKLLVTLLSRAGHDVVTVNGVGLSGEADLTVFDYAKREGRLVLTRNYDDFQELHEANPEHPGVLVVCQDDDFSCIHELQGDCESDRQFRSGQRATGQPVHLPQPLELLTDWETMEST